MRTVETLRSVAVLEGALNLPTALDPVEDRRGNGGRTRDRVNRRVHERIALVPFTHHVRHSSTRPSRRTKSPHISALESAALLSEAPDEIGRASCRGRGWRAGGAGGGA